MKGIVADILRMEHGALAEHWDVIQDEDNGVSRILFDSPESLMGSFGSDVARTIGRMLDHKITRLIEKIS